MSIVDNPKHVAKVNRFVNGAVKALDKVGNLHKLNPTQTETAQILNALSEAYEIAVAKFQPKQPAQTKPSFTLSV